MTAQALHDPVAAVTGQVAGVGAYTEAGFDEVYVGQVGGNCEGFFEFYVGQVLPRLRDA
jgi:hypothetical protein